jgi:hypothetical protein
MTLPIDLHGSTEKVANRHEGRKKRLLVPSLFLGLGVISGVGVAVWPSAAAPISTAATVVGVAGIVRRR